MRLDGKRNIFLVPSMVIGSLILFLIATIYYPGGNQLDIQQQGYSWLHNYWCNLMNVNALNGLANPARPWAIASHTLLCSGFLIIFIGFGNSQVTHPTRRMIFLSASTLCMGAMLLIFSSWHDIMTTLSSIFGLWVVGEIIYWMILSGKRWLLFYGLCIGVLLGINNYIYYSQNGLYWLPIIQKITFVMVILWVLYLNQMLNACLK